MKNLLRLFTLSFISTLIMSCSKEEQKSPNPNVIFKATLSGMSEVPSNTSSGTGTATLTFNSSTKKFTLTATHSIATPTLGHIHKGAAGANGAPVFGFTNLASPITYTSATLDAVQEADLFSNLYYVNIHSSAFPGGEIRGQLIKQTTTSAY
jgi:hypothetical protein